MRTSKNLQALVAYSVAIGMCCAAGVKLSASARPGAYLPKSHAAQYVTDQMLSWFIQVQTKMMSTIIERSERPDHQTITNGSWTCYLVKVEKGTLDDSMSKLKKDKKNFDSVGRNYIAHSMSFQVRHKRQMITVFSTMAVGFARRGPGWKTLGSDGVNKVQVGVIDTGVQHTQSI